MMSVKAFSWSLMQYLFLKASSHLGLLGARALSSVRVLPQHATPLLVSL